MTRRQTTPALRIETVSPFTVEVRGARVYDVLNAAGIPKMYARRTISGGEPCWTSPTWAVPAIVDAARRLRGVAHVRDADEVALW